MDALLSKKYWDMFEGKKQPIQFRKKVFVTYPESRLWDKNLESLTVG